MFTVCPKCTLTLAVTAGDLRTGQGYVRCGRCSNVFNALLTLSEQPPDAAPSPPPPSAAPSNPENLKAAAASASQSQPASEVASSIQIDRILMLGGSAFPRPQAASAKAGTAPSVQRSSGAAQGKPTARAPQADSAAQRERTASTQTAAAPAAAAAKPGGPARSALEANTPVQSDDVTDPLELARRGAQGGAPRGAKPPRPSILSSTPAPSSGPPPSGRSAEEAATASADEAELIERSGGAGLETRTVETIVLEGDGYTQTEEFVSEEQAGLAALRREIESLGDEAAAARPAAAATRASAGAASPAPTEPRARSFRLPKRGFAADEAPEAAPARQRSGEAETPSSEISALGSGEASIRHRWAWLCGSIALALLLALQGIDHWRDGLAASPSWGPVVTHAYAAFGVTLEPHWDLAAYEVRQQGAEADPKDAHVIHVRLSLANHARRAQPAPLLRLTLLDRYGKRIARRDLSPGEYWPPERARQNFLGADQRIDSEVVVRDPNADSASFELDVCLRARGQLRCAMDSAPATANLLTP